MQIQKQSHHCYLINTTLALASSLLAHRIDRSCTLSVWSSHFLARPCFILFQSLIKWQPFLLSRNPPLSWTRFLCKPPLTKCVAMLRKEPILEQKPILLQCLLMNVLRRFLYMLIFMKPGAFLITILRWLLVSIKFHKWLRQRRRRIWETLWI